MFVYFWQIKENAKKVGREMLMKLTKVVRAENARTRRISAETQFESRWSSESSLLPARHEVREEPVGPRRLHLPSQVHQSQSQKLSRFVEEGVNDFVMTFNPKY